jgi:hypothetical protein
MSSRDRQDQAGISQKRNIFRGDTQQSGQRGFPGKKRMPIKACYVPFFFAVLFMAVTAGFLINKVHG